MEGCGERSREGRKKAVCQVSLVQCVSLVRRADSSGRRCVIEQDGVPCVDAECLYLTFSTEKSKL